MKFGASATPHDAMPNSATKPLGSTLGAYLLLLLLIFFFRWDHRSFALRKPQEPLSSVRARSGQGLHTRAVDRGWSTFSKEGKILLSEIVAAGDRGDWQLVKHLYSNYDGQEIQIFNAVMWIAYQNGQYREGALVWERLRRLQLKSTAPTFTAALKIFTKLGQNTSVREVWTESLAVCKLDEPLAAARIDAAAAEGDVKSAAEVLDLMNRTGVEMN